MYVELCENCKLFLKTTLKRVYFLTNGKKPILYQSTKKMINRSYLIIDLFRSFQFVVRYLNILYIISIYKFISDINPLSLNWSVLCTEDSCKNYLFLISYDIFQSFDERMKTRVAFLDIHKENFEL